MKKAITYIIAIGTLGYLSVLLMFSWLEGKTIYADGYTHKAWEEVHEGMSLADAHERLGPPLDYSVNWGYSNGEENWDRMLWSRPETTKGYWSCLWVADGIVMRKQRWHSD